MSREQLKSVVAAAVNDDSDCAATNHTSAVVSLQRTALEIQREEVGNTTFL